MSDAINPDHYKRLPAEAIKIIEAMIEGAPDNKAAYLHGQAAKYDLRLWRKGKSLEDFLSDWGKHIWYALRLESHLLELIEKQKADEQQKSSDLQSLKDHPFGKLKKPKWTPKIGDWVRIKKPIDTQASACIWVESMNKYDGQIIEVKQLAEAEGILHDDWGFMFEWLEPAEPPKEQPQPPDGWRWLEVGEVIRKGDQGFENNLFYAIEPMKIGMTLQAHWMPTIRRNRFKVGEKVIDFCGQVWEVEYIFDTGNRYRVKHKEVRDETYGNSLTPYIEETK